MVKVVAHPETGLVITPSKNNPEYGTFRVDSKHTSMENGFLNIQKRSAFIRGKVEDLTSLNLTEGMQLPGQIIKKESFTPFYEGQNAKINPQTAEIILTNGMETFLEYAYTSDKNASDTWVGDTATQVGVATGDSVEEQEM